MPNIHFAQVDTVYVTPEQSKEFKAHEHFVPVHRYPDDYEIRHNEIGMLAVDGDPYKRIFYV